MEDEMMGEETAMGDSGMDDMMNTTNMTGDGIMHEGITDEQLIDGAMNMTNGDGMMDGMDPSDMNHDDMNHDAIGGDDMMNHDGRTADDMTAGLESDHLHSAGGGADGFCTGETGMVM